MQGLNIMAFCKEYNAATQDKVGTVIPVEITCFEVRPQPPGLHGVYHPEPYLHLPWRASSQGVTLQTCSVSASICRCQLLRGTSRVLPHDDHVC